MKKNEMKRYDAYKPSGVEWLGEIPAHWEVMRLKNLASLKARIGFHGLNSTHFIPSGPYCITGTDFAEGKINFTNCYKVSDYWYDLDKNIQIKNGDLLVTKDGTIGKIAFVDNLAEEDKATLNSGVFVLRTKMWPRNLYWQLNSDLFRTQIDLISRGSTINHLYERDFRNFAFILPPASEQTAIAQFLDSKIAFIDKAIALKEKQIALLKERRQAIIHQAVTKGLNPDAPMKDSGIDWIGKMPAHWEVKKIKYISLIFRGKFSHRPRNDERLYNGSYPFFQTGDVASSNKYLNLYKQTLNEKGLRVSTLFPKGTVVITIAANIGDVAILDIDACFPDSIVGFKSHKIFDGEFLYYCLSAMKEQFIGSSIKNTQMNLNVERIGNNTMPIPSVDEQLQIITFINQILIEFEKANLILEQEIQKLKEYKATLINTAITGKINVT